MNTKYEQFVEELIKKLYEKAGKDISVERYVAHKVNVDADALIVRSSESIVAPTIYLADKYQMFLNDYTVDEIAENIYARLKQIKMEDLPIPQLTFENAKKNLYCVVVNAEKNKELLLDTPHEELEDLAVVARFRVGKNASFLVTDAVCNSIHMTAEEVLEIAHVNTERQKFQCIKMEDLMREILYENGMDQEYVDEILGMQAAECPIYVLTNREKSEGAVAVASKKVLEAAYDLIGDDFYILPSSRHEVLLIPKSVNTTVEELKRMVHEVNITEVGIEDILSEQVYQYDNLSKKFSIATIPEKENTEEMAQKHEKLHARSH